MTKDVQLVTLLTAKSPAEAEVVKGILEAAGIPAQLSGEFTTDDLAMSLQASGFVAVDVQVPSDRLEEARGLVEEAQSAGKEMEAQAEVEDPDDESPLDPEVELENQR